MRRQPFGELLPTPGCCPGEVCDLRPLTELQEVSNSWSNGYHFLQFAGTCTGFGFETDSKQIRNRFDSVLVFVLVTVFRTAPHAPRTATAAAPNPRERDEAQSLLLLRRLFIARSLLDCGLVVA